MPSWSVRGGCTPRCIFRADKSRPSRKALVVLLVALDLHAFDSVLKPFVFGLPFVGDMRRPLGWSIAMGDDTRWVRGRGSPANICNACLVGVYAGQLY